MKIAPQCHGDKKTIEIVERVAEKNDTSPEDLPPLYEAIDPDALNALFDSASGTMTVTFTYCNYQIELTASKQIEVVDTVE